MIGGSNALGEALPPHFQFSSNAASEEMVQIRTEAAFFFKRVVCKFGMKEEASLCCTIGANEKGGMDEVEFAKYVTIVLRKLYPDAAPERGKWVILKCDRGPGRMNLDLLASLQLDGFHLFPGVPNTTAVTQETDQNYCPFKGAYARNLDALVDERIAQGKTTSIPAWMVGLVVFGGCDPETKLELPESAFHAEFSHANTHGKRSALLP